MMETNVFVSVLILLVGAACVTCAPPVPCCAPDQFTFHYGQVLTSQKGDLALTITVETLDAAYDFNNALVGMEVSARQVNGTEAKYKVIQNYTAGFEWIILNNVCLKQSLSSSPPPSRCIPADAIFEGTYAVGLEQLKVHSWLINVKAPGLLSGTQRYTVTDYMCTSVSSTYIGNDLTTQPPTTFVASGNYVNMTTTISDPNRWFKLPPSCNSTLEVTPTHRIFKIPGAPFTRFF